MLYDVFLSCKSEDYKYAKEIYNYLQSSGIQVFLAPEELRKKGKSDYRQAIDDAIEASYHLIVFASKASYMESKWVKYEWNTFLSIQLTDNSKTGEIITILKDVDPKARPKTFYKCESFTFENYQDILSFLITPQNKERIEERKKIEEEKKKKVLLKYKSKLIDLAEDYRKRVYLDIKNITTLLGKIGINKLTCPVCETQVGIENSYCPTCGWTISPIDDIEGAEYLSLINPGQLDIAKSIYKKAIELVGQRDELTSKYRDLQIKETQLTELIEKHETTALKRTKELEKLLQEDELLKQINSELKTQIDNLKDINTSLQDEKMHLSSKIVELQGILDEKEKSISDTKRHSKVDLGLSVCWASCNIGSSMPEEFGQYFAWGEVETKDTYSRDNYTHYNVETNRYIDIGCEISETDYDVAHCQWGGTWRLPTLEEMTELRDKCVWTFITQNGQKGYKIIGPNGNSIFLPAAGRYVGNGLDERVPCGNYMLGTLKEGTYNYCYYLYFHNELYHIAVYSRQYGFSVRPVSELKDNVD